MNDQTPPHAGPPPSPDPTPPPPPQSGASSLTPNQAGALAYLVGIITGVIMLVVDQRPFVRFHAFQCLALCIVGVGVWVVMTVLSTALSVVPLLGVLVGLILSIVISLASFVLWLMLMYRAYQGQRWKLPYVGPWAERQAGVPPGTPGTPTG